MFYLQHVRGAKSGDTDQFDTDRVRIGRAADNDLCFDPVREPYVSGRHAVIVREDGRYYLEDVGSANGTFVNSRPVGQRVLLNDGDLIELASGGPQFIFSLQPPGGGKTLVAPMATGTAGGLGTKTVSMMIGDALRDAKQANRGRFGSTTVFMREVLRQASTYSSRRLRLAVVSGSLLLVLVILGLILANVRQRNKMLALAAEMERAKETAAAQAKAEKTRVAGEIEEQNEKIRQQQKDLDELRKKLKERGIDSRVGPDGRSVSADVPSVLFEFDRSNLTADGRSAVETIAAVIQKTDGIERIAVEGHASQELGGSEEHNVRLSQDRATSVAGALQTAGVGQELITAEGFGSARPVADNGSEDGRRKNRRVEVVIQGDHIKVAAER